MTLDDIERHLHFILHHACFCNHQVSLNEGRNRLSVVEM